MQEINEKAREVKQHSEQAIESFRQAEEIHQNYLDAPEKQELTDEVEKFTAKMSEGINEMNEAIEVQKQQLSKK